MEILLAELDRDYLFEDENGQDVLFGAFMEAVAHLDSELQAFVHTRGVELTLDARRELVEDTIATKRWGARVYAICSDTSDLAWFNLIIPSFVVSKSIKNEEDGWRFVWRGR